MKRLLFFLLIATEAFAQTAPSGYTPNYRIRKWASSATPSADSLNANWTLIDSKIRVPGYTQQDSIRLGATYYLKTNGTLWDFRANMLDTVRVAKTLWLQSDASSGEVGPYVYFYESNSGDLWYIGYKSDGGLQIRSSAGTVPTMILYKDSVRFNKSVNVTGTLTEDTVATTKLKFTGVAPPVQPGTVGWDSTNRRFLATSYLVQRSVMLAHEIVTSETVDSNSTAETIIDSIDMATNFPSAGKVIKSEHMGTTTVQGTKKMTLRLRHGGSTAATGTLLDSLQITINPTITDAPWRLVTYTTFRSTGATGACIARLELTVNATMYAPAATGQKTINTTGAHNRLYITAEFDATGNNKIRVRQGFTTTVN